jgi:hypothetical protein
LHADSWSRAESWRSLDIDEFVAYADRYEPGYRSKYYRDVIAGGDTDTFPTDGIVIAYLGVAVFERSLDLASGPEPRVLFTSGPERKGALAENLEKLLYRTAFWRFRITRRAHRACFVPRAGCSLEPLFNAAQASG